MRIRKYTLIMSVGFLLLLASASFGEDHFAMTKGVGDANRDGKVNILDIYVLIDYIYGNPAGPAPNPLSAGDTNLDGDVNLLDILKLITDVFNAPISGVISDHSDCTGYAKDNTGPDKNCSPDGITYTYNGSDVLSIKHFNGWFNCCPIFHADISCSQHRIIIEESETYGEDGPCTCDCFFDVEYELTGVTPGVYTIEIRGLHLDEDEYLVTTVNLVENPTGEYSIIRNWYPWCW